MRLTALIFLLALMGCTQFPDLDSAITPRAQEADYPALVPVGPLLADTGTSQPAPAKIAASINSRVNALKSRAARLHKPVIDTKTRIRMENALK